MSPNLTYIRAHADFGSIAGFSAHVTHNEVFYKFTSFTHPVWYRKKPVNIVSLHSQAMPQTGKRISSQGGKSHGAEAEDGCICIFTVSVLLYVWFTYLLRMRLCSVVKQY